MHRMEVTSGRAVILFTRVPVAGRTKTRMMPYLDAEECAALQRCFLRDISGELRKTGAVIFVCYDSNSGAGDLPELCGADALYFAQSGENLGARMLNAFAKVFEAGYKSCVLIGSDIPEIRAQEITEALDHLEEDDIVIGPSADGGYWMIGMHRAHSCLFERREFSHDSVLKELSASAQDAGLSVRICTWHQDMDTPSDLADYRNRMRRDASLRRSYTGRFLTDKMTVSVIVPVYNEITTIDAMISQLDRIRDQAEIIIADGGSTDGTCSRIPERFTLLHTGKGRAVQMNAGAEAAHGDVLFFLHCDSELPEDPIGEIRRVMASHEAGCFGIAFHSDQFFMWTCRVMSNHRAGVRKIMFGDQGIFITRELFRIVGGYPQIPLMEDYRLSLTLKKIGVRPGMCRHRIFTSERRFPEENIPKLKVMWKMHMLRRAYRKGVPVEEIAAQYRDIR